MIQILALIIIVVKQHTNGGSWQECSRICSYTTQCKYWTLAHADSTIRLVQCCLKLNKCTIKALANLVSGDVNCPGKSLNLLKSVCHLKFEYNFPACNMKRVSNIGNWRECSKICFFTQGCKRWIWSHKGHSAAPHSC